MFGSTHFWDELAIDSYKRILKEKPKVALAHYHLGLAYLRIGRDNKAIRCFERTVALDKTYANAYYHMGVAHQARGNEAHALRAFKKYNKLMREKRQKSEIVEQFVSLLKE